MTWQYGDVMTREQAESEIAKILQALETSSGSVVRSIDIKSIDITQVSDEGKRLMTQVVIELERLPGREWQIPA